MRIETERLLLRQFILEDAPFILELLNSPGWLRFIGDRGVHTEADATKYLEERLIPSYREYGFGFYHVEQKGEQVPIGMCGFAQRPYLDLPDLGFALLPDFTGQGYAVEASNACLAYGQQIGMKEVTAFTLPTNTSSLKLLERVGFHSPEPFSVPGDEEELLLLRRGLG
ncbi:MAG: GNAT family N-acetyltransferase [Bacteroidota bacterium]